MHVRVQRDGVAPQQETRSVKLTHLRASRKLFLSMFHNQTV